MIKTFIDAEILNYIIEIEKNKQLLDLVDIPLNISTKLRKNTKKRSSYASNKIEGNPLTEQQANDAIERDPHKHFLKPEQEIRNYYLALNLLEEKLKNRLPKDK